MALDVSAGRDVMPGTRVLVALRPGARELAICGVSLARRAIYTACRAGFESLWIVDEDAGSLRAELARDPQLTGRSWSVIPPGDEWIEPLRAEPGRWVVTSDEWLVSASLLHALALSTGVPTAFGGEGPFAADAADLLAAKESGWRPGKPIALRVQPFSAEPALCVRVGSQDDVPAAEEALFRSLGRNQTNFLARAVDRPLSRSISRILAPWPITPNQITVSSILLGIAGALMLLRPTYGAGLLGAFLFFASTIVDGCDGEIARLKFQESPSGARLDLLGDNVVHAVLFPCLALRGHFAHPGGPYAALGFASLAGVLVTWAIVYATIVRGSPSARELRFFELFANREFAYGLLALGVLGRLEWFVWAMAFGLWVFPLGLLALRALARLDSADEGRL